MWWPFKKKPSAHCDPPTFTEAQKVMQQVRDSMRREDWIRDHAFSLLHDRDGWTYENALIAAQRIYDGASEPKAEVKT